MNIIQARSVNEAFVRSLSLFGEIDDNGDLSLFRNRTRTTDDFSSPDRGKPMPEISVILQISDPTDRLIYAKPVNIFNMVGLWIYLLRGSDKLSEIEFYNPIARKFVDEEISITRLRANWGERIFGTGAIARIITLLRTNPSTRRAVISVFSQHDIGIESRNLPCLSSIQFLLNDHKLDMYTTMRSQAAIGVMPYDLFLLTMLHEYVSMRADADIGTYHHICPAFGIRDNEFPILKDIFIRDGGKMWEGTPKMPAMEPLEPGKKALFLDCEAWIRTGWVKRYRDQEHLLPPYWRGLLNVTYARYLQRKRVTSAVDYMREPWDQVLEADSHGAFPQQFILQAAHTLQRDLVRV